jgi:undecaprenyl-diphosphatase
VSVITEPMFDTVTRPPPPVEAPLADGSRVPVRRLLIGASLLFAVYLLLPQVGRMPATLAALHHARLGWLALAAVALATTYLMAAVALLGAARRRLPIGRTWAVQVAAAFTNRLAPAGLGGMRTNVQFLEVEGTPRPAAVAAVGLNSIAGFAVHVVGLLAIVPLLGARRAAFHFSGPDLPDHFNVLLAVVGGLVAVGLARWAGRLRARVGRPVREGASALVGALRHPASAAALFGGSAGVTLGYVLALAACTHAFGVGVGLPVVTAVYLGGSAVASVAPTPGGLGALEGSLVAGLTAAGAPAGPAIAAVLTFRLITYWLPVMPGLVAYRSFRRRRGCQRSDRLAAALSQSMTRDSTINASTVPSIPA